MEANTLIVSDRFDEDFEVSDYVAETEYMETFENTSGRADKEAQDKKKNADPLKRLLDIQARSRLIREEIDKPHACNRRCMCAIIRVHLDILDMRLSECLPEE